MILPVTGRLPGGSGAQRHAGWSADPAGPPAGSGAQRHPGVPAGPAGTQRNGFAALAKWRRRNYFRRLFPSAMIAA